MTPPISPARMRARKVAEGGPASALTIVSPAGAAEAGPASTSAAGLASRQRGGSRTRQGGGVAGGHPAREQPHLRGAGRSTDRSSGSGSSRRSTGGGSRREPT